MQDLSVGEASDGLVDDRCSESESDDEFHDAQSDGVEAAEVQRMQVVGGCEEELTQEETAAHVAQMNEDYRRKKQDEGGARPEAAAGDEPAAPSPRMSIQDLHEKPRRSKEELMQAEIVAHVAQMNEEHRRKKQLQLEASADTPVRSRSDPTTPGSVPGMRLATPQGVMSPLSTFAAQLEEAVRSGPSCPVGARCRAPRGLICSVGGGVGGAADARA